MSAAESVVTLINSAKYVERVTPENGPDGGLDTASPCSHVANAKRIVKHFSDQLLYVKGIGWHTWGGPWALDDLGAHKLAQRLGKIIREEAMAMAAWAAEPTDKGQRKEREEAMNARYKWAAQSESAPCVEYSLRAAMPWLAIDAAQLDANPLLLGLPNGVLDLVTGEHREHRQTDYITKVAGCDYDPTANAPTWERFINDVFNGDRELCDYTQRLIGYTLSGKRGEHLLPILCGGGGNGKSTLLGSLQAMFGDYSGTASAGLLISKGGNDHPTGLADLQGRRFVVSSETGESGKLNEEQVKSLTGGDTITARRMRQDFYQFQPVHQLYLQTNHKPRVTGTDDGIWRRIRLIPFNVKFTGDRKDTSLPDKLKAELPGILTWAVMGWQWYQREGFGETPEAVKAATDDYRESSDVIGEFLAECCTVDKMLSAKAGELYKRYTAWAEEAGERAKSQREFGLRLTERGFTSARSNTARMWRGVGLNRD
jgi:putative DNA primase/helicase